ncbi:MAG TPA: MFS transporter [Candidatus Saccharimonadia bacterium]|nr:MFS transporter [Candidatus Saccharimonadia bacterium]
MRDVPVLRLSTFYFVYLAGLGAYSPFFGLYLDALGHSATTISLVMSLWYGTRVVAPGVWSHYTERSARPIAWLRAGTVLALATLAGLLLPLDVAGLFAVMAGFAFFYNAVMPQFEAITLSHLRGQASRYGRIRIWGSIGFVIAVAGLGVMFDHVDVRRLPLVMLPLFAALVAAAWLNDYGPDVREQGERESVARSLARPGVATFLACAFLMQCAHGAFYVFFSLFLGQQGYEPSAIGAFWSIGVLAEIAMFWFAGGALMRHGTVAAMRLCLGVAAVRFVLIGWFPDVAWVVAASQVAHALGFGLFHAALMQRVTELFPPHLVGQGQGLLYGLGSGLGGVAGALLAGLAWKLGGGEAAFVACGAVALAGFAVALPVRTTRAQPAR